MREVARTACENCNGLGVVYTDLSFFESVKSPCEVCGGKRFKDEVLDYKLDGKSIADVLDMTVRRRWSILHWPGDSARCKR
jgi:excinuclease UvrABC ATPase subunit